MPFVAYYTFKLFNMRSRKTGRIFFSSFAAGYISLLIAALLTAIEFGIQPLIAASPDGRALYCPYDLSVAVPAMAIEHLVLFSIAEGLITALIVRYFYRHEPGMVYAIKKGGENE